MLPFFKMDSFNNYISLTTNDTSFFILKIENIYKYELLIDD